MYLSKNNIANSQINNIPEQNKLNLSKDKDAIVPGQNVANESGLFISYPVYALEIITDILLGVIAGVTVNICANSVGRLLGLNRIGILIVQLFLITIVLYIIKIDSKYLYSTWKGETNYGIVFTAVFFAVQKNMMSFFEDIYIEEEDRIGIFKLT